VQSKEKYKQDFLIAFTENHLDEMIIELINNFSTKNDISPKGILAILSMVNDLIASDYKNILKRVFKENFLKTISTLIKGKQFNSIQDWPTYKRDEGLSAAQSIMTNSLKIIKIASEIYSLNEEIIKGDFLQNLKSSFEFIPKESFKIPVAIIHNLVNGKSNNDDIVNNICTDYFIQYINLKFIDSFTLLKDHYNKELITEVLLLLSSLCRKSQNINSAIHDLNIYTDLKALIENTDSVIKSRVCNLIGNMCRHTDFFYEEIKKNGLINPLLKCCYDQDKNTRKFACFAIGNAAFLNEKLYDHFRPIIPRMVELLQDPEDNTRANSAGALGNFVRCGDSLCADIISNRAHEALLKLAETEDPGSLIHIIKVALFALGNFCYHQSIKIELEKINFRQRIDMLKGKFKNEPQLIEHLERIKKKLLAA
jgi:fused-like protein